MIEVAGEWWGTADEVAGHIGQGVTADAVRWWSRYDGLTKARTTDDHGRPQVRYPLSQAIRIDAAKRAGSRGRKRAAWAA
ncbi:hypothetical protein Q0Z83_060350 [Actinoplanes sichuanensis]|uniref:Uncharacterized protein n=1 Tax=Actinoplanes sichuanensis TaxID=512349 RepID=A0ABW4A804_9ACTN|nr:hypothetical protein [Actinoplanes sichuanensis]BEL07844.1 hypothetical protein Q0Z83_060350 [Actinoplanes sichuanensis]